MNYLNSNIIADVISLTQNFVFFIIAVLAIVIALIIAKFAWKLSIKIFTTILLIIAVLASLILLFIQPQMHKTFNFNIIERVVKFNSDGTTSIIETTTTNEVKRKE